MTSSLVLAVVTTGIAVTYVVFVVGSTAQRSRRATTRRLASLQTHQDIMQQSFVERALVPAFHRIGVVGMRVTPGAWADRTRRRLIKAAWYPTIDETSWAAIRALSFVVGIAAFLVLQQYTSGTQQLLLLAVCGIAGWAGPDQLLNRRAADRVQAIERDLPDIIDLLVISTEAGLGFEAALDRVVEHVPGELSDEFGRMLQETRVGVSRYQAMRALAERTDVDDLNSFILAMNQADTFGVSIGRMLRVQADEMRTRRRQRAQEKAFAAPVKMVFPLVLCIFPAIFVILLGPAAISIIRNLAD
jgi:tight adherence protein C